MTDPIPADADLSFEAALTRLESLVQRLESGQAPLEEAVSLYEEGARLRALCEARLKEAQLRVEKVVLRVDGRPTGTAPADFGQ
jgi:exodeoxyribonuclease VII small subunit